jgi:hypothetical protein
MTLDKYTQTSAFTIWTPRYHDQTVLLAAHKVGLHNKILFTKAKHLGTDPYYVSGKTIKKYKKESNGKIDCYAVPLGELEPLIINTRDLREVM